MIQKVLNHHTAYFCPSKKAQQLHRDCGNGSLWCLGEGGHGERNTSGQWRQGKRGGKIVGLVARSLHQGWGEFASGWFVLSYFMGANFSKKISCNVNASDKYGLKS